MIVDAYCFIAGMNFGILDQSVTAAVQQRRPLQIQRWLLENMKAPLLTDYVVL